MDFLGAAEDAVKAFEVAENYATAHLDASHELVKQITVSMKAVRAKIKKSNRRLLEAQKKRALSNKL